MAHEIKIPEVGESVQEVQIGQWLVHEGDRVEGGQDLVEIETDKASLELPAPMSGVVTKIVKRQGEPAKVDEVVAYLEEKEERDETKASSPPSEEEEQEEKPRETPERTKRTAAAKKPKEPEKRAEKGEKPRRRKGDPAQPTAQRKETGQGKPRPAGVGTGHSVDGKELPQRNGRETKDKVRPKEAEQQGKKRPQAATAERLGPREEEAVPLSLVRRRIAQRLVQAQQTAALLTTFNEIDMSAVAQLRRQYGEPFQEKYGVKLGLMSFFVKAAIEALKQFPAVNAEIREEQVIYRNYYDIGFAVGGGKGLVVPVLRNAELMSFAEIEMAIGDLARRVRENQIKPEDLEGGTFTITNGGVYGSLLSTPIVNPPQSAILGLHAIQDRPVARAGEVVVRPMMYVALTYDHRIIDGREAVGALRRMKEIIEDPPRMLLEV